MKELCSATVKPGGTARRLQGLKERLRAFRKWVSLHPWQAYDDSWLRPPLAKLCKSRGPQCSIPMPTGHRSQGILQSSSMFNNVHENCDNQFNWSSCGDFAIACFLQPLAPAQPAPPAPHTPRSTTHVLYWSVLVGVIRNGRKSFRCSLIRPSHTRGK